LNSTCTSVAGQIGGEFAQAPAGEGLLECLRSRGGRRDDEGFVVRADQAGTATRPLRVQAGQAHLVESVDHLPDRVLVALDEAGDGGDGVSAGRGHDHHRAAQSDRGSGAAPDDLLQALAFLIGQPACSNRVCHPLSLTPR
jgi:hypothetical protein